MFVGIRAIQSVITALVCFLFVCLSLSCLGALAKFPLASAAGLCECCRCKEVALALSRAIDLTLHPLVLSFFVWVSVCVCVCFVLCVSCVHVQHGGAGTLTCKRASFLVLHMLGFRVRVCVCVSSFFYVLAVCFSMSCSSAGIRLKVF